MLVKEAMNKEVKVITPSSSIREAADKMNKYRIGSLIALSGSGQVVGIITERDILTDVVALGKLSDEVKVEDVMTKDLITISPDASLEDAADLMNNNKIKKLPVIENGRLVGIITASDLIAYEEKLIEKVSKLLISRPVAEIGG